MSLNLNPRSIILEGIGFGAAHVLLLGFVQVSSDAGARQAPARILFPPAPAQDSAFVLFRHSSPRFARSLLLPAGQQSSAFSFLPSVSTQVPAREWDVVTPQAQKQPMLWASSAWQPSPRSRSAAQAFQASALFLIPPALHHVVSVGSIPPAQQRAVRSIGGPPTAQRPVTSGKARKL